LYVIDSLDLGGTEKQFYLLLKYLDRSCFHCRIVCLAEGGDWIGRIRNLGIELVVLRRNGSKDVKRLAMLAAIMRRFRPDLVHSFQPPANVYAGLAALTARTGRLIVSYRSFDPAARRQKALNRLLNRLIYCRADVVVCNSRSLQRDLIWRYGNRVSTRVISNGIENLSAYIPTKESLRQAIGLAPEHPVVGTAGRLVPIKNHRLFIDIASKISRIRPDVQFLIIGDGPMKASLQEHAAECGVAHAVTFTGQLPDAQQWLSLFDVFVLTTGNGNGQGEGFPNVLMEAMLNQVPCVASKAGGTIELLPDREAGYLVEAPDSDAYARNILSLLENAALREEMGGRAGEIIMQNYSVYEMKNQYQNLYYSLLNGSVAGEKL
jgi:glycosyltransferase involved in cell wall biosynthesis